MVADTSSLQHVAEMVADTSSLHQQIDQAFPVFLAHVEKHGYEASGVYTKHRVIGFAMNECYLLEEVKTIR